MDLSLTSTASLKLSEKDVYLIERSIWIQKSLVQESQMWLILQKKKFICVWILWCYHKYIHAVSYILLRSTANHQLSLQTGTPLTASHYIRTLTAPEDQAPVGLACREGPEAHCTQNSTLSLKSVSKTLHRLNFSFHVKKYSKKTNTWIIKWEIREL